MGVTMRVMAFAGPGAGLQGRIRTDMGGVGASIADTFTVSGLAINVREATGDIWVEVVSRGDVSWSGAIKKKMVDAVEPFLAAFSERSPFAWSSWRAEPPRLDVFNRISATRSKSASSADRTWALADSHSLRRVRKPPERDGSRRPRNHAAAVGAESLRGRSS